MARFLKSKKETIGISPDAILFRGEKKTENTKLRIIDYNEDKLEEVELKLLAEAVKFDIPGTSSWLNIDGLHDTLLMEELSALFDIDPLIVSDLLDTDARPKIHEYDNCLYISIKMLRYNEDESEVSSENLVLVLKENILISFQERVGDVFEPVRIRLRKNKKRMRTSGVDYLTFALLDVVIDNYIYVISRLGEQIEALDDELTEALSTDNLSDINKYKSEVNFLRKTIKPCREMIINLVKLDSDFIEDSMQVHLKELYNNMELANDSLYSYREILSDQLNIFHTTLSYKQNDVLKFLTIFSVIFIPITFIVGVYGTNFDNIPELHYRYGYFIMWVVILITVLFMIWYFRKKKWF